MVDNRKYKNELHNSSTKPMMDCIPQEMVIDYVRLAAAYVPFQHMCELFSPIEALKKGTPFPELFSPYDAGNKKNKARKSPEYM